MTDYIPRVVDAEVDAALATLGAVLIEGLRAARLQPASNTLRATSAWIRCRTR